ncbi:bet1-like SNARE 1-1 isoform X1 [Jatropha curcas]|uniref:bet1-like SNARE 1-1 isoform X1 n=1 Tax=Jatropha curcas TaxID=180498 RepID=UPI0009D78649|nr:bet1-like SNARE 1-1 isoform X1 [Jatropha curcas]
MNYRRDIRNSRSSLFDDGLEEGALRASSSYSHNINEHDNDKAIDSLKDRVIFLKRVTGDIHEEVESHNRLLDRLGNNMDISRGVMSGTMDRFKKDPQICASLKWTYENIFPSSLELGDGSCTTYGTLQCVLAS